MSTKRVTLFITGFSSVLSLFVRLRFGSLQRSRPEIKVYAELVVVPAMNNKMWHNAALQRNIKQLIDELALTQEELGVTLSKSRSAIAN